MTAPAHVDKLALVMGGGGALAAYQVGVLDHLAQRCPRLRVPVITGVSAGAINAAALGAAAGDTFRARVLRLRRAWESLTPDQVFHVSTWRVLLRAVAWAVRLGTGGLRPGPRPRALLDTTPLRRFMTAEFGDPDGSLPGIQRSLEAGAVDSVAVTGSSYVTGRSVTWVAGCALDGWSRADRLGRCAELRIDHVLASAALPILFPAVGVDGDWFGDGGLLLTAPLSPAIHLGASRILAISTRRGGAPAAVEQPDYPPPAQVAGALLNALFLDQLDADALRLQRINRLIEHVPAHERRGLRRIELLVLRPSVDLGALANAHEMRLPLALRFLTRGLGTRETRSNELLSLLMFQPDYLRELIELGRQDAAAREDELCGFVAGVVQEELRRGGV